VRRKQALAEIKMAINLWIETAIGEGRKIPAFFG
jgi:predicted RNase H-like HicB family nuclease